MKAHTGTEELMAAGREAAALPARHAWTAPPRRRAVAGAAVAAPAESAAATAAPDPVPAAIERVLAGDLDAFGVVVRRYERPVFALCLRLLGGVDRAQAEDLAQETFIRAYRCLASLEDRRRFGAWLFQIARSLVRDHVRRRRIERRAVDARVELLRLESVPAGEPDLSLSFGALPPEEQEVLRLRYFEGWTYDDIARHLGCSFSQVDHRIRKARARLERHLEREKERDGAL